MKLISIVPYFFVWHYSIALANFVVIWKNFFWFVFNYFSFVILLRTLFAPYKRLTEKYKGGLDITNFLESIFINFLMRIIGFLMRIGVLVLGVMALFGLFVLGLLALFVWITLPFLLIFIFFAGLFAIFGENRLTM